MYFLQRRPNLARASLVAALLAVPLASCAHYRSPDELPPDRLQRLAERAAPGALTGWPAEPRELERALEGALEVREAEVISSGMSKPLRVKLRSEVLGRELEAKWKRAPNDLEIINNSPRREIAAYELQKLFLPPEEWVVPTTVLNCLAPDAIPDHPLEPQPPVPGRCVVGALQAWLEDVEVPERKLELERFWDDPVYAYHAANVNLLTILIDHSDSHSENLLRSTVPDSPRLFAVDNGISFGSWFRNPFVRDWNRLRVPALRSEPLERLRALKREDLDVLGVVAQLDCGDGEICRPVEPGDNLEPGEGVRIVGEVVQLGLTRGEIDGIWKRRERLLRALDRERIAVF